jgi:acyl-CoA reductase-like NAD-dependent aldehyde dehydrogenase
MVGGEVEGGCVGGGDVGGGEVIGGIVGGGGTVNETGGMVGGGGNVGVVKGGMVGGGGTVGGFTVGTGIVGGGVVGKDGKDGNDTPGELGDVCAPAEDISRLAPPNPTAASTAKRRFHVCIPASPASCPTQPNLPPAVPPARTIGGMTETIVVRSPYDGHEVGQVPRHTDTDVDRAVGAAGAALRDEPLPPWRRAEILHAAARLLAERSEDFARTIAEEAAKPIKTARLEAKRAVSTFTFAAVEARRLTGQMVPIDGAEIGEGRLAFTLRVPVGVVAAISPFNFPLNLVAHKLAPAIAAGCPVVLKPASQTPLSAVALARLLVDDCGLPPGYLHVVTGGGGEVGNALVEHPDVAYVTFTGSSEVGWGIAAKAGRKKVALELGNNSPVIVEADGDWEGAARTIATAGFSHAGQSCVSVQRIYVAAEVADGFTALLAELVDDLTVGDPMDEATDVSALITEGDRDRVQSWIDEAVGGGAKVAAGGSLEAGVLRPTVLTGVTPEMKVCRDEVFGPVVAIQAYDSLDEALRLADDTRYGLQAGIYTSNLSTAVRAARELHFGTVLVNEVPTWRADQMPYGGVRESGNTKEGPAWTVREMTEERLVVIRP